MKKILIASRGNGKTLTSLAWMLSEEFKIPFKEAYKILLESLYTSDVKGE